MHARTIVLVMVAACGYAPLDSTGDNSGPDGGTGGTGCQAPTSYGAATVTQQSGDYFPGDATYASAVVYQGALNATNKLSLWLFDGDPPFSGSFKTGTFQLSGQTNLMTCGSCVIIAAGCNNCDVMSGQGVGSWYIANAGTLTLTNFTPTNIAGTIANATLVHVNISSTDGATTPAGDGCTTQLTSASFSAALAQN